jgi:hypothetical protein
MLKAPHLSKHRSSPPAIIYPSSHNPDRASPEWHTVYHISATHEAKHDLIPIAYLTAGGPTTSRFVWQTTTRPRLTEDEQGLPAYVTSKSIHLLDFPFPFRTFRTRGLI